MRTVGMTLLMVELRNAASVLVTVQDSRSVHGLLYLAAVQDDRRVSATDRNHVCHCDQECCGIDRRECAGP